MFYGKNKQILVKTLKTVRFNCICESGVKLNAKENSNAILYWSIYSTSKIELFLEFSGENN